MRQPNTIMRRLAAFRSALTGGSRTDPGALTNAGVLAYARGDYNAAMRDLTQAAEADHPTALYNLGIAYAEGLAVPVNLPAVIACFRRAAELGHDGAAFSLGQACRTGEGTTQDHEQAARWYRQAAEGGDVQAANELGLLFVEGLGVAPDPVEGFAWIYPGTHQNIGYEPALNNALHLAKTLSPEDIREGTARGEAYYWKYFARQRGA